MTNGPLGDLTITGPPPVVHIYLAPGRYSLSAFAPKPERVAEGVSRPFRDPFTAAHVPILINGFTLRLTSTSEGATIDAEGLSRHFELLDGSFSYNVEVEGSLSVVFATAGGSLILENVHLVNGRSDLRQPTNNPYGDVSLTSVDGTHGGGCVLVQSGSLQVKDARIMGCVATNLNLTGTPSIQSITSSDPLDSATWYHAPRGGAIDVLRGSVALENVDMSTVSLLPSGRVDSVGQLMGSRGGLINLRSGSSLTVVNSRLTCQGFSSNTPSAEDLDAKNGGAIAGSGATIAVRGSTIRNCRALEGGAIYLEKLTTQTSAALTLTDSQLIDNAVQCVHGVGILSTGNPTGGVECQESGFGGCIVASAATVTITSSTLLRCRSLKGYGGALYALQASTVSIISSNITGARATAAGGAVGMISSDDGKGGLASLRGSTLTLESVKVEDVQAESGDNLLSFLPPLGTTNGRRLQSSADASTSALQASELAVEHECSSATPSAATLLGEGTRAVATVPLYRVSAMRGLRANFSGPCDAATLRTSLTELVTVGDASSGPSICANASQTCNGLSITAIDGSISPVCASGATCTCVPVVPSSVSIDTSSFPASPECSCAGESFAADIPGIPIALVPYDAPGVGCEVSVTIASHLYSSEAVVVSLSKPNSAQINTSVSLGGTAQRAIIPWSIAGSMPSWLAAIDSTGVASKPTTEAVTFDVPLELSTLGLREGVGAYAYPLQVRVGLRAEETTNITVSLIVTAEPVAIMCSVEAIGGGGIVNASTVLNAPVTFVLVARDIDGLELNHQVAGFSMSLTRDGSPLPAANTNYRFEYLGGGRYQVEMTPTLRGGYELLPSYNGVAFSTSAKVALTVGCPEFTLPYANGLCACAPGRRPNPEASTAGQPACLACAAGLYKDTIGDVGCTECFLDASSPVGATSRAECHCNNNNYRLANASEEPSSSLWLQSLECRACPVGASCTNGATPTSLNLSHGHWRVSPTSLVIERCLDEASCLGGINTSTFCREGHMGPLCAVCEAGYTRSDGVCEACATGSGAAFDAVALVPLLVTLVIFGPCLVFCAIIACSCPSRLSCLRKPSEKRGYRERPKARAQRIIASVVTKLKIMTAHQQVLQGLSGAFSIGWPPVIGELLARFKVVNFDVTDLLPIDCIVTYRFLSALVVRTLLPFVVVVALLLAARGARRRGAEALEYLMFNGSVLVIFMVYPSVTQIVFSFFQTHTLDDGSTYLISDYSVNVADDAYLSMRWYAYLMVAVWPFGVPLVIAMLLFRSRGALSELRRRERVLGIDVAYDGDAWMALVEEKKRNGAPPDARDEMEVQVEGYLWSLTEGYRASVFYFEVLEYALQKLVLVGMLVFFNRGSLEQLLVGLVVCFVYFGTCMYLTPFGTRTDNLLVCVTQFALFIALLTAVILEHGTSEVSTTVVNILGVATLTPAIFGILLSIQAVLNELGVHPLGALFSLCSTRGAAPATQVKV